MQLFLESEIENYFLKDIFSALPDRCRFSEAKEIIRVSIAGMSDDREHRRIWVKK